MVMFRDHTRRAARKLRLVGSVRNLLDGSVEVIAQGDDEALRKLLETLQSGSILSRVDAVESEWREPTATFDGFGIVY